MVHAALAVFGTMFARVPQNAAMRRGGLGVRVVASTGEGEGERRSMNDMNEMNLFCYYPYIFILF